MRHGACNVASHLTPFVVMGCTLSSHEPKQTLPSLSCYNLVFYHNIWKQVNGQSLKEVQQTATERLGMNTVRVLFSWKTWNKSSAIISLLRKILICHSTNIVFPMPRFSSDLKPDMNMMCTHYTHAWMSTRMLFISSACKKQYIGRERWCLLVLLFPKSTQPRDRNMTALHAQSLSAKVSSWLA